MNTAPLRLNQLAVASKEPFFQSTTGHRPQPSTAGHHRDSRSEKNDLLFPSRRRRGGGALSPPAHVKEYYANDKDCSFLSSSGSSNSNRARPAIKENASPKPSRAAQKHTKVQQHPPVGAFSWRHPLSRYTSRRRDPGKNGTLRANPPSPSGREETHRRPSHTVTGRNYTKSPPRHVPSSSPPPPGRHIHAGEGYRRSRAPSGHYDRPMVAPPPPRNADTSGASTQRPTMMRMSRMTRPSPPMPGVPKWIVCHSTSSVAAVSQMTDLSQDDDDHIDGSLPRLVYTIGKHADVDDDGSVSDLTESSVATLESYNIGSDYSPVTVGDDDYF